MKVLQITAFSGWGCTGRIAQGIHNSLISKGHQSVIAWGRTNTAPSDVVTIKIGNSIDQKCHGLYTRVTDKCGFLSKSATIEFLKKVDDYKPDVIQLHIMHGYYINIELLFQYIKEKNIPVVWTFHDCWAFTGHCPYFDFADCQKWKEGCYKCGQKKHHPASWILDNSNWNWEKKRQLFTQIDNLTIVTPSEWLAALVRQSFLRESDIKVIRNGINLNNFKPTYGNIKEKYKLGEKKIILGVSSTWVKSKGLEDFYTIAKDLPEQYQVVLVGLTKKQKNRLPEYIKGIERTDNVIELAELYTAASVFVNPTYEDNYPTTNLEALACGTPVVTYETGGSVEAVNISRYGKIVQKGNCKELIQSILEIGERGKNWRKYSCDFLNENYKFEEYVDLYESLI